MKPSELREVIKLLEYLEIEHYCSPNLKYSIEEAKRYYQAQLNEFLESLSKGKGTLQKNILT